MKKMDTKTMVLGAVLTALVVVLQLMGSFIRFGMFSISLVLLPIVIGAAVGGVRLGAWLGLVFGGVVLLNGDAAPFLAVHIPGTILTVLAKGILCGLMAGIAYKALAKWNLYVAVAVAALVCPIVNTGVFLLGCNVFFMETISTWAEGFGYGNDVARYMIFVLVGGNFLVEMGSNILLSPVILRLLHMKKAK